MAGGGSGAGMMNGSEIDDISLGGNTKKLQSFEEKLRERERDEKQGILAPREPAYSIGGAKYLAPGRISRAQYQSGQVKGVSINIEKHIEFPMSQNIN